LNVKIFRYPSIEGDIVEMFNSLTGIPAPANRSSLQRR
jgi:hypothetical protein